MQIYAYRCNNPACHQPVESTHRGDQHPDPCPTCHIGVLKRRWQVSMAPVMQAAFSEATQTVVSDMRKFRAELRQKSEEYTEKTGIPADFQPCDWQDLGATGEGLDAANVEREKQNLPPLRLP
jgi:hypothetical protein